jgi:hypothetical protein
MATPLVIYKGEPKPHSWARWMHGRVCKKNNSVLASFVGPTGSGKTYSAISSGDIVSRLNKVPFTIENVVFGLKELMELINSGTLKRGSVIIFDEPQASISSKDFQSVANKVFNLLISTIRHRNLIIFFCTPFESLLDKSTRKLFHARFETLSIDQKNKTCRLKPRFLEHSETKTYVKQLCVSFKDNEGIKRFEKLFHWDVPKPSDSILEAYEQKKLEFTTRLNQNIMAKLDAFNQTGKSMTEQAPTTETTKLLTPKQQEVLRVLSSIESTNKYEEASKRLGITIGAIAGHVKLARKKGWQVEDMGVRNE